MTEVEHRAPSCIEDCPNEILDYIISFIPQVERKRAALALRVTCHRFNPFSTPLACAHRRYLFGIVSSERQGHPEGLQIVMDLVNDRTPDVFVPFISSIQFSIMISPMDGRRNKFADSDDMEEFIRQFTPYWDDVQRFKALKSVTVYWGGFDEAGQIYESIARSLLDTIYKTTNGQLLGLTWNTTNAYQSYNPLSTLLPPFRSLQSLDIDILASTERTSPKFMSLGGIIARNPDLRFVKLSCNPRRQFYALDSSDLFPFGLDNFAVETIAIIGALALQFTRRQLDEFTSSLASPTLTLPTMNNLREIIIHSMYHSCAEDPDVGPLWLLLKDCGVRLSVIDIDYGTSRELMEYLASYNGLERANLNVSTLLPTDSALRGFPDVVLPQHAASLTSLKIFYPKEISQRSILEGIELDPDIWPTPSSFTGLESLHVVIPRSWSLNEENCQRLLDYASEIPMLRSFETDWLESATGLEFFARVYQGNISIKQCALQRFEIFDYHPDEYRCAQWDIEFPRVGNGESSWEGERFALKAFKFQSRCCPWISIGWEEGLIIRPQLY